MKLSKWKLLIKLLETIDFFLGFMHVGLGCWDGFMFIWVLIFVWAAQAKFFKRLEFKSLTS
jgi:hypothetical protein